MFEALRKYGTVLMLLLMGVVFVCLIADEYDDAQQLAKQAATSACMSVVADDFDWDEDDDDDFVSTSFAVAKTEAAVPMPETIGQKAERSKCSQALLRGQVRRYSPRNGIADSHNYAFLKTTESGVDFVRTTFFVQSNQLSTKFNSNEKSCFIDPVHGIRIVPERLQG
ncbi:MAG: hypothetical protein IJ622_11135 [Bacteroidales bacterium]|nr:hypothetical protein [Bacteroidales bacterium]